MVTTITIRFQTFCGRWFVYAFEVLQIGYSLPGQMLQRVGVKGLRFFVQGENLFTITNYSGYDPEVGTRDGFDGGTYPQARTYTIGANITF